MPLVRRTRATLRSAEVGFFGVVVYTRVQTPRRWGAARRFLRPCPDLRPGVATLRLGLTRPLRTSWLIHGMRRATLAAKSGRPDWPPDEPPLPSTLVHQRRTRHAGAGLQGPRGRVR